ncbi:hypothetical protein WMY93_019387 [Mugilogobius chulae]|uniref:Uncharacterized protein n=1 Tax=Mugilogobius chulae TaxID=88201 RepID=A0AAW0NR89_9GOBI
MWTVLGLCVLLALEGLRGATAATQVQIYGKSVYGGLRSGYAGRQRQPQLTRSTPNQPTTIIRLYPPTAKPLHLHANMPLRFGRRANSHDNPNNPNMPLRFGRDSDSAHNQPSNPNMPLRFGRYSDSEPGGLRFERESESGNNPTLPQRFGRAGRTFRLCSQCSDGERIREMQKDGLYWSLLRTIHNY